MPCEIRESLWLAILVALYYFSCTLLATFGQKISPRKKISEEVIHENRTACNGSHNDVGGKHHEFRIDWFCRSGHTANTRSASADDGHCSVAGEFLNLNL
jgi:hypothetical protein